MTHEKPKTVTVKALQLHTYDGKTYDVGDTYEIDEQYAETVVVQGKAERVDAPEPGAGKAKPKKP